MSDATRYDIGNDIDLRLDPAGGITIKAVTPCGDPVELSATQARKLAAWLNQLADRYDVE